MKKERFYSLDIFRGAAVAFMILVNNPGTWSHIYPPLRHASWHGVTPTDLVFPFFLFAVGNAFAFVMPRLKKGGAVAFWKKITKRTFLIFLIGFLLSWMPFFMWQNDTLVFRPWEHTNETGSVVGVRISGVLQRIALAYFFASIIVYYFKVKTSFIIGWGILLGYWALTYYANPSDSYSLEGWFGTDVDKMILGEAHMYHGQQIDGKPVAFDPEGLMSLFGSIVQVIFGYVVGHFIIKKGKTPEMTNGLFVGGSILLFIGYAWGLVFPINKQIWTSSYTVYTTGMAMLIIGVMVYFIELRGKKGAFSNFFNVFGKNPLFIFVLSGAVVLIQSLIRIPDGVDDEGKQIYRTPLNWFYEYICTPIFGNNLEMSSVFYAICLVVVYWLIGYWMDKKKIYIKV